MGVVGGKPALSHARLRECAGSRDCQIAEGVRCWAEWTFIQTLALLNLQVRGEEVQSYLPRVIALLEAGSRQTRLFGRDALRLAFTPLGVQLDAWGYDPDAPTDDCRSKVAKLRETAG